MPRSKTIRRLGRIDDIEDLAALDLTAFSDGDDAVTQEFMANGFGMEAPWFRAVVEKWGFARRGKVADVGSGVGRWSVFLAEVNRSVVGYEKNEAGVKLARRLAEFFDLPNLRFQAADIAALPAAASTFEGVWLQNTLQALHRADALNEIRRILKPGGLLFVGQYKGLGRVLEVFFMGYARGGVADHWAQVSIHTLKQGPLFNGAYTYASPDHLELILDEFGFELSGDYPLEVAMNPKAEASAVGAFSEELRDPMELGRRLESDPDFAAAFARRPDVAFSLPMYVQFCALKR